MTHTTNYNLNKFEAADRVTRDGFNQNADRIDAAIKAASDAAGTAQSTANTCWSNCRIVSGTYVGTGAAGSSNPNSLTFSGKPIAVIIVGYYNNLFLAIRGSNNPLVFTAGGSPYADHATWSDSGISWFAPDRTVGNQMSASGTIFYYYAILSDT